MTLRRSPIAAALRDHRVASPCPRGVRVRDPAAAAARRGRQRVCAIGADRLHRPRRSARRPRRDAAGQHHGRRPAGWLHDAVRGHAHRHRRAAGVDHMHRPRRWRHGQHAFTATPITINTPGVDTLMTRAVDAAGNASPGAPRPVRSTSPRPATSPTPARPAGTPTTTSSRRLRRRHHSGVDHVEWQLDGGAIAQRRQRHQRADLRRRPAHRSAPAPSTSPATSPTGTTTRSHRHRRRRPTRPPRPPAGRPPRSASPSRAPTRHSGVARSPTSSTAAPAIHRVAGHVTVSATATTRSPPT